MSKNDQLTQYKDLAEELREAVTEIENLYSERTKLQEQSQQLSARAKAIGRQLFEFRNDPAASSRLESQLEDAEATQRTSTATLSGLSEHLATLESELHAKLSPSCFTFERLLQVLRSAVRQAAQTAFEQLLHPSFRDSYREQCEVLSEHSVALQELADVNLPSGGTWVLARSLDQTDNDKAARPSTMQLVVTETHRLLDSVERIFEEIQHANSAGTPIEVPEFFLGAPQSTLPQPYAEPQAPLVPMEFSCLAFDEQAHIRELCEDAKKDVHNLTDQDKLVLANSLELYRKSRLRGIQRAVS